MSRRNKFSQKHGRRPGAAGPETAFRSARPPRPGGAAAEAGGAYWLYGRHAVKAALANPMRRVQRLLLADPDAPDGREIAALAAAAAGGREVAVEPAAPAAIAELLPEGAVHQGVAARVLPLPAVHVEEICERAAATGRATVLVLDQVTDPHNVGAILRSAAAFGAAAVLVTERNAPPETGALAKAASGALELVPLVRATNLVRALDALKSAGFWCAGLAAEGTQTLAEAKLTGRVALVLGSEGEGLRRLTRERCDLLVRLPTSGPIGHLNVSNAAAVALYELARDPGTA